MQALLKEYHKELYAQVKQLDTVLKTSKRMPTMRAFKPHKHATPEETLAAAAVVPTEVFNNFASFQTAAFRLESRMWLSSNIKVALQSAVWAFDDIQFCGLTMLQAECVVLRDIVDGRRVVVACLRNSQPKQRLSKTKKKYDSIVLDLHAIQSRETFQKRSEPLRSEPVPWWLVAIVLVFLCLWCLLQW